MNKWQIICPIAAMLLFVLALDFLFHRNIERVSYLIEASFVGRDLITTTNSDRITSTPPEFKRALAAFLASPAKSAGIRRHSAEAGHPETPIATVILAKKRERLAITLRWQPNLRKFDLITFTNQPDTMRP